MKKIISLLLTFLMLAGVMPAYALRSSGSKENIASGKTIWASSFLPGYGPENLVDDDINTGWSSNGAPSHWIAVDLGREYSISNVEVVTRQDYNQPETRANFEIRLSNDPNFKSYIIAARQGQESLPHQSVFSAKVVDNSPYRYAMVTKTDNAYFFFSEFRVYGTEASGNSNLKAPPEYSDVSDNEEEIRLLGVLDIINGYEDGTFCPEKFVTRAEAAKMICKMLEIPSYVNKGLFSDVPATYWGCEFIEALYLLGAVNGKEADMFYPENPVTGMEMMKMLISAMGYTDIANLSGGYPNGYMKVANILKWDLKNVKLGESLTRSQAAELIYNALMSAPISFGGVKDNGYILKAEESTTYLEDVFGVTGSYGVVNAVAETDLASGGSYENGQIKIGNIIYQSAQENLFTLLGKKVHYFWKEVDGTPQAILVTQRGACEEIIIEAKDIIHTGSSDTISYYSGNKVRTQKLSPGADIIYNGRIDNVTSLQDALPTNGEVRLVMGDNGVQYVFITNYEAVLVDGVLRDESGKVTIYNKMGTPIIVETEKPKLHTSLTDSNGNSIGFGALEEWDVVLCATSKDGTVNHLVAADDEISGKIDALTHKDNGELEYVSINGEEYAVSVSYLEALKANCYGIVKANIGSDVKIHLDSYGNIAAITETLGGAETSLKYGYLSKAGISKSLDKRLEMLLFTDSLSLVSASNDLTIDGNKVNATQALAILEATAVNGQYGQLIRYKMNAKGEVRAIYTSNSSSPDYGIERDTVQEERYYVQATGAFYNVDNESYLPQFYYDSNTKFFEVPEDVPANAEIMDDADSYRCYDGSQLENYKHYYAEAYNLDDVKQADVVLLYNKSPYDEDGAIENTHGALIVIHRIIEISNQDGETVRRVYGYVDGNEVSYDVFDKLDIYNIKFTDINSDNPGRRTPKRGDVLRISTSNNQIVSAVMIFCAEEPWSMVNGKSWDNESVYPPVCRVIGGAVNRVIGDYVELAVGNPEGGIESLSKEVYPYKEATVMLYNRASKDLSVIDTKELQSHIYTNSQSIVFARTNFGKLKLVLILE